MSDPKPDYSYSLAQCQVEDKSSLERYRAKRREWLIQLKDDEHHAISSTLYEMVWTDMSFRTIWEIGAGDPKSSLNNQLVAEALIQGYFARQILAIRRLIDKTKGTMSLVRVLGDIQNNVGLITRENYVAFDGVPYDHEEARERVRIANVSKGAFFAPRSGPDGYNTSERAHHMFDCLTGIDPARRSRTDRLPKTTIDKLVGWLTASDAQELADWSHNYLAHAASQASRQRFDLASENPISTRSPQQSAHLCGSRKLFALMSCSKADSEASQPCRSLINSHICQLPSSWHRARTNSTSFGRSYLMREMPI